MELQDLQKTLSRMTNEELLERLKEIRASRRISKDKPAVQAVKKHKEDKSLDVLLASASKADIARLIAALGGKV